jgi:hypothetical protein
MAHNVTRGVKTNKVWMCRWIGCTKLTQTGCNSFCKAHNKESLNILRTRDDKEVAASLASLGNNVNNEQGLANVSGNVDNEWTIRNNDGKVSVRHDKQLVKGIGTDNNGSVLPEAVAAREQCAADGLDDNNELSVQHNERFVKGIGADNNGSVLPEAVVARERCAADGLDDNNGLFVRHNERLVERIGADNNGSVLPEAVVARERCAADGLDDNNGLVLPDAGVALKRCAVEGVVNVQGLYSTLTQSNVWPQVEPAIDNGDDGLAIYDNWVSIPSVAYVTALERRINVLEQSMRQVASREASHQDLE